MITTCKGGQLLPMRVMTAFFSRGQIHSMRDAGQHGRPRVGSGAHTHSVPLVFASHQAVMPETSLADQSVLVLSSLSW